MKRGRTARLLSCTRKCGKELGEAEEDQNSNSGYRSITELPRCICIDILLRLSLNRLLVCRCVCKTWRCLISDPEFAKLHFAKGEVYSLIRSSSRAHISRTLYLVEPPDPSFNYESYDDIYSQKCICYNKNWLLCELHCPRKLETKLKIPLRNSDIALNAEREADANLHSATGSKRKRCIKLRAQDHRFNIVNSCNSLLCLSEPSKNDPVAVCNPITGEYINLPIPTQDEDKENPWVDCALGFSPQSKQYKVIRMFGQEKYSSRKAEIHVLGTSSWRRIGHSPSYFGKLAYPTFVNGSLHWLFPANRTSEYIVCFNFDKEQFQPLPSPQEIKISSEQDITLGVLRGCLCMCCYYNDALIVWVMEEYGVQRSWTMKHRLIARTHMWSLPGLSEPISVLSNGGMLLFYRRTGSLLCYHPDGMDYSYLKIRARAWKSKIESICYVPSFIRLKDVVEGEEVEVMNINSRCAGLKLLGESQSLYLQEADPDMDIVEFSDPYRR